MREGTILRRLLALVTALMLMLGTMPLSTAAAEETTEVLTEEVLVSDPAVEETNEAEQPKTPAEEAPADDTSSEQKQEEPADEQEESVPSEEPAPSEEPVQEEENESSEEPQEAAEVTVYFVYDSALYGKTEDELSKLAEDKADGVKTVTAKTGDTLSKPSVPALTGYRLDGWYKDAACTKEWRFSVDLVGEKTLILYANWVKEAAEEEAPVIDEEASSAGEELPAEEEIPVIDEEIPAIDEDEVPVIDEDFVIEELPVEEDIAEDEDFAEEDNGETGENGLPTAVYLYTEDGIKVSGATYDLPVGESVTLEVRFFPDSATDTMAAKNAWTPATSAFISLEDNGDGSATITASETKTGKVRVTARTAHNKTAYCFINVYDPNIPTGVTIKDVEDAEMGTNYVPINSEDVQLECEVLPEDLDDQYKDVTWTITAGGTSAKIDKETGILTTTAKTGTVTVKAVTKKGGRIAVLKLTVYDPSVPQSVVLYDAESGDELPANTTIELSLMDEMDLLAKALPEAADQDVTWASSSRLFVSVDESGHVIGLKEGTATISATTKTGKKKASVKVHVYDPYKPQSVTIDQFGTVELALQDTLQVNHEVLPETANPNVTWSSSNTKVATVNADGLVTPVAEGTATIKVKTDYLGRTASFKVKVYDPFKPTKIELSESGTLKVDIKDAVDLTVTQYPLETADSEIIWKSSNAKIASIEEGDGTKEGAHITLHKKGTVTITATAKSGGRSAKVKLKISDPYEPTGITLNRKGIYNLAVDDSLETTYTLKPAQAESDVTFKSSNAKIATVDESGTVTGVSEGTVTITATIVKTGKKATYKVKVNDPYKPTKITLTQTGAVTLTFNETLDVAAVLFPEGTAKSKVIWTSSNKTVATVDYDADGTDDDSLVALVTACEKEGTATITAKTVKNSKSATFKVQVIDPSKPSKLTLDYTGTVAAETFSPFNVTATVYPDTATQEVEWTSSKPTVAEVSEDGIVTPISKGTAKITAKVKGYPTKTAFFTVVVTDPYEPSGIVLTPSQETQLEINGSMSIEYMLESATGFARSGVTWTTSNDKIVTISAEETEDGENSITVTGVAEGRAKITAKTKSGNRTAYVYINVIDPDKPTALSINRTGTQTVNAKYNKAEECYELIDSFPIVATVTPASVDQSSIKWTSSKTNVADISEDGTVPTLTINGTGSTVITAKCGTLRAYFTLTVTDKSLPTALTLNYAGTQTLNLGSGSGIPGDELRVVATLTPDDEIVRDATNIVWTSSNESVATVEALSAAELNEANGEYEGFCVSVKPVKEGRAVISAATSRGSKRASFIVEVVDPFKATAVLLTPDVTQNIAIGGTVDIKYSLLPANSNSTVRWTSSNPSVAKVEEPILEDDQENANTVRITGVTNGTAVITATASSGVYAKLTVNVTRAEGDETGENWNYAIDGDRIIITGYRGTDSTVVIPNSINSVPVTKIRSFGAKTGVTKVIFGENVTEIGAEAFKGCTALKTAVLNKGLEAIGDRAFYGTRITSLTLPSTVETADSESFYGMKSLAEISVNEESNTFVTRGGVLLTADKSTLILYPAAKSGTTYTVYEDVTTIQKHAFANVGLTGIAISKNVTSIEPDAFDNASALSSITVASGNAAYSADDGILFEGSTLFLYPTAKAKTSYTMPDTVTAVASGAFINNTVLATLHIGENVTDLPADAIKGCANLSILYIPAGVTENAETIMSNCPALTTVIVANGNSAYSSDSGVLLNADGTEIIKCPVRRSTPYTAKQGITKVCEQAFMDCSVLTSVSLAEGLESIGKQAFANCAKLTSVTLPKSLADENIDTTAFENITGIVTIYAPAGSGAINYATRKNIAYVEQ